jgi:hypothetical protein
MGDTFTLANRPILLNIPRRIPTHSELTRRKVDRKEKEESKKSSLGIFY